MATTWILHTATKGTGATMVPLESVTRQPAPPEPPSVPAKPRPRPKPTPAPREPRRFRVVDVMTRQHVLDDGSARAAIDALTGVRSIVDVDVYVWQEERGRWRRLTFAEQRALFDLAHEPSPAGPSEGLSLLPEAP